MLSVPKRSTSHPYILASVNRQFANGVSDAVFSFFYALAVVAAIALATSPSWRRTVVLGVVLGCGAATKLSPLFVAVPLAVIGAAVGLSERTVYRVLERVKGKLLRLCGTE